MYPTEWIARSTFETDLWIKGTLTLKPLKGTATSKSAFEEGHIETEKLPTLPHTPKSKMGTAYKLLRNLPLAPRQTLWGISLIHPPDQGQGCMESREAFLSWMRLSG